MGVRLVLLIPAFLVNLAGFLLSLLIFLMALHWAGTSAGGRPWSWAPSLRDALLFGLNLLLFWWSDRSNWRTCLLLGWVGNLSMALTMFPQIANNVVRLIAGTAPDDSVWFVLVPLVSLLVLHLEPPINTAAKGKCSCGYDLTGNTSGVCPECGAAVAP